MDYVAASLVYPEDNTTMGFGDTRALPNQLADEEIIQTVANKITTSLWQKTSK